MSSSRRRPLRSVSALAFLGATLLLSAGGEAQEGAPTDSVRTLFVSDSVPGFGAVGGVAVDALGYRYLADFRNAVWRLSPDGLLEKFADGLYGASGNAIGPRGELYQSSFNGNYITRVERDGTMEIWVDEGLAGPVGIAVAEDGALYVTSCNGGSVQRVAPDRTVTTFVRSELLACPNGITFDDRGDLWVVNFNNPHVVRITPDGTATSAAQITGAGGNGHITFARGGFYVTQFRGNRIFRLERDGSSRALAGTGQPGGADGPALEATFTRPNGIAAGPSGNILWVNDLVEQPALGRGTTRVAFREIRLLSLADVLAGVPTEAGTEGLEQAYRRYRARRPGEETSPSAVTQAYAFLSGGRVGDGVALLRLNAESYPEDATAQFHLGEGYRYTGRPEEAAAQYRRVLELAPEHGQAAARLEMVAGG